MKEKFCFVIHNSKLPIRHWFQASVCSLLVAFLLLSPVFCLLSPSYARLAIREHPVAEISLDNGMDPVSFIVDENGRLTLLDNHGGAIVQLDADGRILSRVALLKHPELSVFSLQDLCRHESNLLILELEGHQVLVYRDGKRSGVIPLPAECVLPFRIGTTREGMLTVFDLQNGMTLILDGQGRVTGRLERQLDEWAHGRSQFCSWEWIGRDRKGVSLQKAGSLAGPWPEFYKMYFPKPVERLVLLGTDSDGNLYLRADTGFGLEIETWLARISSSGSKRWLLSFDRDADSPVTREIVLGRDGNLYALHRYPKTILFTRLEAENSLVDE